MHPLETNLLNIAGIALAPLEIRVFARMLQNPEHTYAFEEGHMLPQQTLQALDMLVLAGLIERFCDADGEWLNHWTVTDQAVAWVQNAEVQADLSLVAQELGWCSSDVDISLTSWT